MVDSFPVVKIPLEDIPVACSTWGDFIFLTSKNQGFIYHLSNCIENKHFVPLSQSPPITFSHQSPPWASHSPPYVVRVQKSSPFILNQFGDGTKQIPPTVSLYRLNFQKETTLFSTTEIDYLFSEKDFTNKTKTPNITNLEPEKTKASTESTQENIQKTKAESQSEKQVSEEKNKKNYVNISPSHWFGLLLEKKYVLNPQGTTEEVDERIRIASLELEDSFLTKDESILHRKECREQKLFYEEVAKNHPNCHTCCWTHPFKMTEVKWVKLQHAPRLSKPSEKNLVLHQTRAKFLYHWPNAGWTSACTFGPSLTHVFLSDTIHAVKSSSNSLCIWNVDYNQYEQEIIVRIPNISSFSFDVKHSQLLVISLPLREKKNGNMHFDLKLYQVQDPLKQETWCLLLKVPFLIESEKLRTKQKKRKNR